MKIRVESKKLKDVLSSINKFKMGNNLGIYLETVENDLKITGLSRFSKVEYLISCEVTSQGNIKVDYLEISKLLKNLKDKYLVLYVNDDRLAIENDDKSFSVSLSKHYYDITEFSTGEPVNIISFDKNFIVENIKKVIVSVDPKHYDESVNCVHIKQDLNKIYFVGTDTYRMAYITRKTDISGHCIINIPYNVAEGTIKSTKSITGDSLKFTLFEKHLMIESDNFKITSYIEKFNYVDYNLIVLNKDKNKDKRVTVKTSELKNILNNILDIVKNNKTHKNLAILNFKGDTLNIEAKNDTITLNNSISSDKTGDDITIRLSTKFLLDFIKTTESNELVFELGKPNGFVNIYGKNDTDYLYFVMPIVI